MWPLSTAKKTTHQLRRMCRSTSAKKKCAKRENHANNIPRLRRKASGRVCFFYSRARTSKSLKVHSQCSAQVFLWIFYFYTFFFKPPKIKCFKLLHVLNNFRQFHRLWNILNFLSIFFFICFTSLGNIPLRTFFLRDKLLVIRTEPGWSSK